MEQRQLNILKEYRNERERTLSNASGEASGRIYNNDVEEIKRKIPTVPLGPLGFVKAFRTVMKYSPVEIRKGEIIVGDYYYLMAGEMIELPSSFSEKGIQVSMANGHTAVNVEQALKLGWAGIREKIESSLNKWYKKGEESRVEYLTAMIELIRIIQTRIKSYAEKAEELARSCTDAKTKGEYYQIADICTKLVHHPPDTFREAVQWYWYYVTMERVTSSGMGACKLDRVFYPYYRNDIEMGVINDEDALSLIQALFLKEGLFYCLGGIDEDRRDEVNELSFLALRAYDSIGGPSNLNVRWHPDINRKFFDYAIDILVRHKAGVPNIVNDEVIIPSMKHWGFNLKQARTFVFSGCFWYVVPGKEYPYHDMEAISGVDLLKESLNDAARLKPDTFKDFYEIFRNKQKAALDILQHDLGKIDAQAPQHYPEMIVSMFMDGCIEKGKDVTDNAVDSSMTTILYIGLATVVDSLYTINKMIYEDKVMDWEKLIEILDNDFRGYPEVKKRADIYPKYGNDDDEVDNLAVMVAESFKEELRGRHNTKGFCYRPAFYSWNRHISDGYRTGATPDGRLAGNPVSQGVNPAHGRPGKGITALINSVSKINYIDSAGAPVHIHMSYGNKNSIGNIVKALVISAFMKGISQMILNFTDKDMLRKAIDNPDDYWNLVIRVTGYSARYVQLSRSIQEEIIRRDNF